MDSKLGGKSNTGHTHDDRYYTETEVDNKLSGKSDTNHSHDSRYYTESEMDTKLNGKANSSHTHDDRYYTESEMNTKLSGKSDTSHGHSGMLTTSDIVNNCTSTATNKPLAAAQGKVLMDKYNQLNSDINTVMEMSFTYASGFSDCDSNWKTQCFRIGKRLYVKINCKRSSALAAGSTVDILTLNSSLSLYGDFNFVLSAGPTALIGTVYASRTVSVRVPDLQTLAANTWVQGYFEIILK